jgi:hypothetical protein
VADVFRGVAIEFGWGVVAAFTLCGFSGCMGGGIGCQFDDVVGDFGGNRVFVGVTSRLVYADESGHFDIRDDGVTVPNRSDGGGNSECDKME